MVITQVIMFLATDKGEATRCSAFVAKKRRPKVRDPSRCCELPFELGLALWTIDLHLNFFGSVFDTNINSHWSNKDDVRGIGVRKCVCADFHTFFSDGNGLMSRRTVRSACLNECQRTMIFWPPRRRCIYPTLPHRNQIQSWSR